VPALGTVGTTVGAGPADTLADGRADAWVDRPLEVTEAVAGPGVGVDAHADNAAPATAIAAVIVANHGRLCPVSATTPPPPP